MKKYIISLLLLSVFIRTSSGDDFCGIHNKAFQAGESITFTIFYSVIGIYINAGNANFSSYLEKYEGKPTYHIVATGNSNSHYDWIFKVRDRYESYFDTATLQPYRFIRNVNEGGYKTNDDVIFNQQKNTATSTKGTFKVPNCIQDVISAVYYARNINFNAYKPEDRIPFDMFLDNEVYHLYVKYMGKEAITTKYGTFNTIKFKPLLIKGNMFEGGEKMNIWVTDDDNHIPVRIESPITVGTIKVDLMDYKNLRHPLTSLIKRR